MNHQFVKKNILQNNYQIDYQKVQNFQSMNLFNLTSYKIQDTTYFIPSFLQIYNEINKKREIVINPEKIEYFISQSQILQNALQSQLNFLMNLIGQLNIEVEFIQNNYVKLVEWKQDQSWQIVRYRWDFDLQNYIFEYYELGALTTENNFYNFKDNEFQPIANLAQQNNLDIIQLQNDFQQMETEIETLTSNQNNFYQKIVTNNDNKIYIFYQLNNVLNINNLSDNDNILYRKETIDGFFTNQQNFFQSQINDINTNLNVFVQDLQNFNTQIITINTNISNLDTNKISKINSAINGITYFYKQIDNVISLEQFNQAGLNYYSENTGNQECKINISGQDIIQFNTQDIKIYKNLNFQQDTYLQKNGNKILLQDSNIVLYDNFINLFKEASLDGDIIQFFQNPDFTRPNNYRINYCGYGLNNLKPDNAFFNQVFHSFTQRDVNFPDNYKVRNFEILKIFNSFIPSGESRCYRQFSYSNLIIDSTNSFKIDSIIDSNNSTILFQKAINVSNYTIVYNTVNYIVGGYGDFSSNGTSWSSFSINWSGQLGNDYYYKCSIQSSHTIYTQAILCYNSSAFLKQKIEKIDLKKNNLDNLDIFFDYNIFSYSMNDNVDRKIYGCINEDLAKNSKIQDSFQCLREYQLFCNKNIWIKEKYKFEDLQNYFNYQNENNKEIELKYFQIEIRYLDSNNNNNFPNKKIFRLFLDKEKQVYINIDFTKEYEIEFESNQIKISLNCLSFGNDQEKQIQYCMFQTKILFERIKQQQKQIEDLQFYKKEFIKLQNQITLAFVQIDELQKQFQQFQKIKL